MMKRVIPYIDFENAQRVNLNTLHTTIKSFKESNQPGCGNIGEDVVKCHFTLYCKKEQYAIYEKLGDVSAGT